MTDALVASIAEVEVSLRRRFRVVVTGFPAAGRTVSVLHPASADELIDEAEYERDERMPYWAEVWPSAHALGAHLLGLAGGGRRLLELGAGCGFVSVCAALAGFDVTPTDYETDALAFVRVNAARNGAAIRTPRVVDWRETPADLGRFDIVVAADVLYEARNVRPVASAIVAAMAPGGFALVADPGRVARAAFIEALCDGDHTVDLTTVLPYEDGLVEQSITLIRIEANRG